jgi:hypothetical protein
VVDGGSAPVGVIAYLFLTLRDASGNSILDPPTYAAVAVTGEVAAVGNDLFNPIPLSFEYSPADR